MFSEKLVLGVADYGIFGATLAISVFIGIYVQLTSKTKTNAEYFLAGKNMSVLPVAFSIMATLVSATTQMGIPAEMYLYGTNMVFMNFGYVAGATFAAYVILPIFFKNDVSTGYEYLELRFGKVIRRIVSATYAVSFVLLTAATLYAPALALSAVTNLSTWMSVISIGVVCTFYCTLGGMKAVLWTDVFQTILMFTAVFAICIKGCLDLGGVYNVFKISNDGGRLVIPKFSFDMAAHYTMFNVFFQGFVIIAGSYSVRQDQIQRLMAVKSVKQSQKAALLSIPMSVTFHLLCCFCGLIFYAYFRSCDPLTSPAKPIYSADQLMPYFITSAMNEFPGLPGLCIAGIFSASLSTVSSGLNSLAAVTSEDFIRPFFPKASKSVFYTKAISLFYGLLCIVLSFLMESMGNLVPLILLFLGMFCGPCLAVFLLAACTKTANEEGAVLGFMSGVSVAACLSLFPQKGMISPLPLSNECPDLQQHLFINSTVSSMLQESVLNQTLSTLLSPTPESTVSDEKFHLAYMWISSIALLTCLIVGFLASLVSRYLRGNFEEVPETYLSPIRVWFAKINAAKKVNYLTQRKMHKTKVGSNHVEATVSTFTFE